MVAQAIFGKSNQEIADSLFVTEKTTKFHFTNIHKKLEIRHRSQLIAKWYRRELPLEVVEAVNHYLPENEKQLPLITGSPSFVEVEELVLPSGDFSEDS